MVRASRPGADGHPSVIAAVRHVNWVRIDLTGPTPCAEMAVIGHRRPLVRSIPLRTARSLAAAGVPTVVRRSPAAEPAPMAEVG